MYLIKQADGAGVFKLHLEVSEASYSAAAVCAFHCFVDNRVMNVEIRPLRHTLDYDKTLLAFQPNHQPAARQLLAEHS